MAVDAGHPTLCALSEGQILDGLCFAAPDGVVADVWAAGRHRVSGGRHVARDAVAVRYRQAVAALVSAA